MFLHWLIGVAFNTFQPTCIYKTKQRNHFLLSTRFYFRKAISAFFLIISTVIIINLTSLCSCFSFINAIKFNFKAANSKQIKLFSIYIHATIRSHSKKRMKMKNKNSSPSQKDHKRKRWRDKTTTKEEQEGRYNS